MKKIIRNVADHGYRNCNIFYGVRIVIFTTDLKYTECSGRSDATAKSYIFVIIAGLVATFLYDACAAALRSLGDTVTPLVILAISVALNIVGDLLFVVVLKSGVRGAAIATVLAQAIAFVVCWIYMVKRYELIKT